MDMWVFKLGVFLFYWLWGFFDKALSILSCLPFRAAAQSKLNNYREAIKDCERAIAIDPKYSKAYGRMGYANTNMSKHWRPNCQSP